MSATATPRTALVICLLVLALSGLAAENVRGPVVAEVALAARPDFESTVQVRHGDLVLVTLPEDSRFLDGVQFELVLSAEARRHYDNFGFVVYDRLDGSPSVGPLALSGRKAFLHYLLAMNRLFYTVAFGDLPPAPHDLTQGIFRLAEPHGPEDFPLLVGVVPIMKGVPDVVQDLVFYLKTRPIVRNAGDLQIRVLLPEGPGAHEFSVFLDDVPIGRSADAAPAAWEARLETSAGIHTLRVSSLTLQPHETTLSVEPGGHSELTVQLRELAASVTVEAPAGTAVYVDGTKMDYPREKRLSLPVGEHTFRLKLGEFSATRSFTVSSGRSYTLFVELGVSLKED